MWLGKQYLQVRLCDIEARLNENHFQNPVDPSVVESTLALLANGDPSTAFGPAPLAFVLEGSPRPLEFQFDDSLNNVEMLCRFSFLLEKLQPHIEPAFLLPLPSEVLGPKELIPVPLSFASPCLVPYNPHALLSDLLSGNAPIAESRAQVRSSGHTANPAVPKI